MRKIIILGIFLFIPIKVQAVQIKTTTKPPKKNIANVELGIKEKENRDKSKEILKEAESIREKRMEELEQEQLKELKEQERKLREKEEEERKKRIRNQNTIIANYRNRVGFSNRTYATDIQRIKDSIQGSTLSDKQITLLTNASKYLGIPYIFGASESTHSGTAYDCSGFTQSLFRTIGTNMRRTANLQWIDSKKLDFNDVVVGDLVFFERTYPTVGASHVGVYIGKGNMIHASSGDGFITVENVFNPYFIDKILGFGRPRK